MSLSGVEETITLAYSDPGSVGITTGDSGVEKRGEAENWESSLLTGEMKLGTWPSELGSSVCSLAASSATLPSTTKETELSAPVETRGCATNGF